MAVLNSINYTQTNTSHVTLPWTPTTGNLLVVFYYSENGFTVSGGWTELFAGSNGWTTRFSLQARVVQSGDTASIAPNSASGGDSASMMVFECDASDIPSGGLVALLGGSGNSDTTFPPITPLETATILLGVNAHGGSGIDPVLTLPGNGVLVSTTTDGGSTFRGASAYLVAQGGGVEADIPYNIHDSDSGAYIYAMLGTPPPPLGIEVPHSHVMSITAGITADIYAPFAHTIAVINFPTQGVRSSEFYINVVAGMAVSEEVAQARVMAIVQGRRSSTTVRAWTFTLDGHDFYVLRLADDTTLVYDLYSEQWVEWTSGALPFWRANAGLTWIGAQALADTYGSNVVVGDDTQGLLWFLDPEQAYDENPDQTRSPNTQAFPRIITGQVLAKGRQYIPCYVLFLSGDNYGLTGVDFSPTITLETSDDQGRTYDDQGTLDVVFDSTDYTWYSLGLISNPGRIFRFTDNGVFARIDGLDMNDDG